MAVVLPFPSLQMLKDLPHRVPVGDELRADIDGLLASPPASNEPAEKAAVFFRRALELTDRSITFLYDQTARLTQERFATGDPNALRQRLLGEPKRLVDQNVAQLRQKVGGERQDWQRRIQKQLRDVEDALEKELAGMETATVELDGQLHLVPTDEWYEAFDRWVQKTFDEWSRHLAQLLRSKYADSMRSELDTLEGLLDVKLTVQLPVATPPMFQANIGDDKPKNKLAVPTTLEAILETFKNGLNTVAMMAGLIVVPVIGSLMHESPMQMRALVMGGMIVPIGVFAVFAGKRTRSKLLGNSSEKSKEQLAKALASTMKGQLDRFKADVDRYCVAYGQSALEAALGVVEPAVAHQMQKREGAVADELAKAQITVDRINEQLMALRQAKGGLAGQLRLDIIRRLGD